MFSDWESHWDIKIEKSIPKNMADQDGGIVDSHAGTTGLRQKIMTGGLRVLYVMKTIS